MINQRTPLNVSIERADEAKPLGQVVDTLGQEISLSKIRNLADGRMVGEVAENRFDDIRL